MRQFDVGRDIVELPRLLLHAAQELSLAVAIVSDNPFTRAAAVQTIERSAMVFEILRSQRIEQSFCANIDFRGSPFGRLSRSTKALQNPLGNTFVNLGHDHLGKLGSAKSSFTRQQ